ncbi:MAG: Integrase, partial [Gemmatimonadales bacterium]|nr:Integrase [Gemmatimonadales bacterium]
MPGPYKSCRTCRDAAGRKLLRHCPRLTERDHGAWYIRLNVERAGVRYQPERGPFRTKREAAAAASAERTDRSRRTHVERDRRTVGEYLWSWLDSRVNIRPSTRHSYETHLRVHLVGQPGRWRGLGRKRLFELTTDDIETLYADLRGRGMTPMTLRRVHATLHKALNDAVRKKRLPLNPATYAELETATRRRVEPWSPQELGRFLDTAMRDRLGPMYELTTIAGLRRGEVCGLRWCDVDTATGELAIRQTIVSVGATLLVGPPKTESGERRVDVDAGTLASLTTWQAVQAAEREAAGHAYVDWRARFAGQRLLPECRRPGCSHGLVFTRENGSALRPDYVTKHLLVIA